MNRVPVRGRGVAAKWRGGEHGGAPQPFAGEEAQLLRVAELDAADGALHVEVGEGLEAVAGERGIVAKPGIIGREATLGVSSIALVMSDWKTCTLKLPAGSK